MAIAADNQSINAVISDELGELIDAEANRLGVKRSRYIPLALGALLQKETGGESKEARLYQELDSEAMPPDSLYSDDDLTVINLRLGGKLMRKLSKDARLQGVDPNTLIAVLLAEQYGLLVGQAVQGGDMDE